MTRTSGLPAKVFAVIFLTFPILTQALKWEEYKFDRSFLDKGMGSWTEDEIKASVDKFFTDWDAGNTQGLLNQMEEVVYVTQTLLVPKQEILTYMEEPRSQGFTTQTIINKLRPWAAEYGEWGVGVHGRFHVYNSGGKQVSAEPAVVFMGLYKSTTGIKVCALWKAGQRR